MKKNRIVLLLALASILLASCSFTPSTSQVKIKNSITDFQFLYGLRLGDAEFEGSLQPDQSTSYLAITPGSYYVEAKTSSAAWVEISSSKLDVSAGKTYTLTLTGSYNEGTAKVDNLLFTLSE
jgi:hypothetical protein